MKKTLFCQVGSVFVVLLLFGCGEVTRESKIEDASIAMDQRDFNKAISLLDGVLDKNGDGTYDYVGNQDPLTQADIESAQLLASAQLGLAGIDLVKMINLATTANTASVVPQKPWRWKMNEWLVPSAFAQGASCISDKNFKVISEMIPPPIKDLHINALARGIFVLGKIVEVQSVHPDQIKQAHLLRVIGHFANIVAIVIEATDTDENNIPDHISEDIHPDHQKYGVTVDVAIKVVDSFKDAIQALIDANIIQSSELSKSVKKLKETIGLDTSNPSSPTNKINLENFLRMITSAC
ncbi:MAG: hypothetical protein AAB300_04595 [Nitrospirota bacterium]